MLNLSTTTESDMGKKRRNFSSKFKAKVALEAIKERQSLSELAQKYELHPNQISTWKKELLEGSSQLFETKRGAKPVYDKGKEARLFQQIGQLQFELDWLKKKYDQHS
jgi:putative transposase